MKKILCLALAVLMLLSLTACGGAGLNIDGNGSAAPVSNLGKYYIDSMYMDGETMDRAAIADQLGVDLSVLDSVFYLEITAEGKASLVMGTVNLMGYDSTSIWPEEDPDDTANFTVANGTAVIDPGEYTMTFKK